MRVVLSLTIAGLCAALPLAQSGADPHAATLERVGIRVRDWYARAQNIVSQESVLITALGPDLSPAGFPRRLAYELRVSWDAAAASSSHLPEPTILRQLLTVNGRPPKGEDEGGCMDPKAVSPEPLAMLLPERRTEYVFQPAGATRVDGRRALMFDYRGRTPGMPSIEWTTGCVSVDLPGRSRGRLWIDAETDDVLRIDEQLIGLFEFPVPREHQRRGAPASMLIERSDASIRYRRVAFENPPETLMLPAEVNTLTIVRAGSVRRTRIAQRFSGYKRFLADARVLP